MYETPLKQLKELGFARGSSIHYQCLHTGWIGGSYGIGRRIKLSHTHAIIRGVINGNLDSVAFETHPVFGGLMLLECPDVPSEM